MLLFVIIFNCCLTVLNIYLVYCLWRLFFHLSRLNQALIDIQFILERALNQKAQTLTFNGHTIEQLKHRYRNLRRQIRFLSQFIFILTISLKTWRKTNRLYLK